MRYCGVTLTGIPSAKSGGRGLVAETYLAALVLVNVHRYELSRVGVLPVHGRSAGAVRAWREGADDRLNRFASFKDERLSLKIAARSVASEETLGDISQPPPARCSNASRSRGGRVRPRLTARRRIPAAAFWLKQNLNNSSRQGSRTSDNEHATASLWDSEVLSVKHAPDGDTFRADTDAAVPPSVSGNKRPVPGESSEYLGEVFASVAGESASDILPHHPRGPEFVSDSALLVEESASLSTQASTFSSHAEVLAGTSSHDEIGNRRPVGDESLTRDVLYVVVNGNVGIMGTEDAPRLRVDLATERDLVSGTLET